MRRPTLLVLATIALTLIEGTGNWLRRLSWNPDASWAFAVLQDLPTWAGFAMLFPAVAWVSRKWPVGKAARNLLPHFVAMVAFTAIHIVGVGLIYDRFFHAGPQPLAWRLREQTFFYAAVEFVTYWTLAAIAHAIAFHDEMNQAALARARLEQGLAEARLDALRAQLEPHFLFNTLNAVSTLALKRDHDGVVRTVGRLAELLRATLDSRRAHEITLEEEFALLVPYIDIQRTRFGDRVQVEFFADEHAGGALVPTMLLQPLVENALVHGIEKTAGQGMISIRARREDDRLVIDVDDTGPGFVELSPGAGIGLANSERRLKEIHGDSARLERGQASIGGARVRVVLPYRAARGAA